MNNLPNPTKENPYAQLYFIFDKFQSLYPNEITKNSHNNAFVVYIKFLKINQGSLDNLDSFTINSLWDELSFYRFNTWAESNRQLSNEERYSSNSISSYLKAIRSVMKYAYSKNYINKLPYFTSVSRPFRETNLYEPYTSDELEIIIKELIPYLDYAERYLKGYEITGAGKDPRVRTKNSKENEGWSHLENVKYYFENVMNSNIELTKEEKKQHKVFFAAASNSYGGTDNLLKILGISDLVCLDLVVPLYLKLILLTALNAKSVVSLKRDCLKYDSSSGHEISFYKERGSGHSRLYLRLFNNDNALKHVFENTISDEIIKTVNDIKKLTEKLQSKVSKNDKDCLFLFQKTNRANYGETCKLENKQIHNWLVQGFKRSLQKKGINIDINLVRFRPTRVAQLFHQKFPIEIIQAICGHKSIFTTQEYLSGEDLKSDFKKNMSSSLQDIKSQQFLDDEIVTVDKINSNISGLIKDEDNEKWNKCLTCKYVLITKNNLSSLFNYKSELEKLIPNVTNNQAQIEKISNIISIIDSLLKYDEYFSEQDIKKSLKKKA